MGKNDERMRCRRAELQELKGLLSDGLISEDVYAVAKFVGGNGADAAAFVEWSSNDGPAVADRIADSLRTRGMSGAPAYLVAGEYFQGRQHLPMIEWLLEGQEGPGPI